MNKLKALRPSIAAFLLMMAMGTCSSGLSFFVSPVCADLGIGRGSFGIYYSLMTAAGAVSTAFLGQYISRKGVKNLILYSGIWFACGLCLFSFSNSLWMFYLVGAAMGLLGSSCMYLCSNVIIQQSYSSSQASSLLGFVMAGSGVGGMVFSLILPGVIENFGWRFGYRFVAVCWLLIALAAFLLVEKKDSAQNVAGQTSHIAGMSRDEAMHSPRFYLMVIVILIYCAACGVQQQLPSLLEDMAFPSVQVGMMISVMTAGLAVGKILQGMLYSKVGLPKGAAIITILFAAGLWMLTSKAFAYPGLVCLAIGMGIVSTLFPTVVRFAFGAREFAAIWSILSVASSIGSFVGSPIWGMVYDGFGSYLPALMVTPILLLGAFVCLLLVLRGKKY